MKNNTVRNILLILASLGMIIAMIAHGVVRKSEADRERMRAEINETVQNEDFKQQVADTAESQRLLSEQFGEALNLSSTDNTRGPLDVKRVTYLIYCGGICHVDMYIITADLNVEKYSINPEGDKNYDFLAGELPSEDLYEVTEYEISDLQWESIVDILTRVKFSELEEDVSTKEDIFDGSSYYICVETSDATYTSGGYMAGYDHDSSGRRFAEAKEMIENAVKVQ